MQKLENKTLDLVSENINQLRDLFPEAFKEGKIDFDALRRVLGDEVETEDERYSFTWHGKSDAIKLAIKQSTGTLKPCKEESKDWDTTQNLFIEGDNLEVLRILQTSYRNKIKMIYIDPPYNTGNDFIYEDDFKDPIKNYKEKIGEFGKANPETAGRYHTNWLNMMYPRLRLARNLLKDDGVIFISIDDNEEHNLRKICDEIYGENNFIAKLVWEKKKKGTFLSNTISSVKEYILVYSKDKPKFNGLIGEINHSQETYPCVNASNKRDIRKIPSGIKSKFSQKNYYLPKGEIISVNTMDLVLHSNLVIEDGILAEELLIEGNWRYQQDLMTEFALNGELYITQDLYLRRIVNEPREKTLKDLLSRVGDEEGFLKNEIDINNLFLDGWGSNEDGEEELRLLLDGKSLMDFPKPQKLIEKLTVSIRDKEAIILDFFAGSATTAHAVMSLNTRDRGCRKFILVQIPELINKDKEAYAAGFKTIADIGRRRIDKAGEKIKSEKKTNQGDIFNQDEINSLDIGFKVFKLEETNFTQWDEEMSDKELSLLRSVQSLKPNCTQEDALYEILLKYGIDISLPIEGKEIRGKKVFSLADNYLLICLEKDLGLDIIEEIAKLKPNRVVFYDDGFKDDSVKLNAEQTLKKFGVEDIRVI
jgi:adenine-specific DNA-methyltransferase